MYCYIQNICTAISKRQGSPCIRQRGAARMPDVYPTCTFILKILLQYMYCYGKISSIYVSLYLNICTDISRYMYCFILPARTSMYPSERCTCMTSAMHAYNSHLCTKIPAPNICTAGIYVLHAKTPALIHVLYNKTYMYCILQRLL